jgi:UTP--glucose-1-phosphate uridylyltransferase
VELESTFMEEGARKKLELIHPANVNIFFLRQQVMAGTGNALMLVEPFVGDEPFVVAYPDDVVVDAAPLAGQMIEVYERTGMTVLAGQELLDGDVSRYGVMELVQDGEVERVRAMVEKPPPGTEPSRVVAYGRYLYTPELFDALHKTISAAKPGEEFTQTEAINAIAKAGRVAVCRFQGTLLDVGTPQGYLHATVEMGLRRPEYRAGLLAHLRQIVAREG